MAIEPWLPMGMTLPSGSIMQRALFAGDGWQIIETADGGRALIAIDALTRRWIAAGLIEAKLLASFSYGELRLHELSDSEPLSLCPVNQSKSPGNKAQALAFAQALKTTRDIDGLSSLHNALYCKKLCRLLPVYSEEMPVQDDVILGQWLTGGVRMSVTAVGQLQQTLSWLAADHLVDVLNSAGFTSAAALMADKPSSEKLLREAQTASFELPGRPALTAFFHEHIIDIVQHAEQYEMMGIGFPSPVVLHGPPGCGKTYAVERLVEYLGWPCLQIDASSVASPYIHDTSKKIADVFEQAIEQAPSVLVIDEMDAFLADRQSGGEQHRVEEVAEFLRRIPQAQQHRVLILGMTNRIDIIDPAILRRGRFDHIVKVDYAREEEVQALLNTLLATLPKEGDLDVEGLARELANRPLSDVTYVVREAARLAARAGQLTLTQRNLQAALAATESRTQQGGSPNRIGFI